MAEKATFELEDLVNPKLQNIICYLAERLTYLTEERLHKLVYTAEIYYSEKFGKRLKNLKYQNYPYGVYSPEISLAHVCLDGICLNITEEETQEGHPASFMELIEGYPIELLAEEKDILDNVIADWEFKSTTDLIEFTKSTLAWESSSFGEDLNLDEYIDECKMEETFITHPEISKELERIQKEEIFVPLDAI